jgi:hypothetical protein
MRKNVTSSQGQSLVNIRMPRVTISMFANAEPQCIYLVIPRTNLKDRFGTPLYIADAGLLERIDNRQIEQSGIVTRSVRIFDGREVFGVAVSFKNLSAYLYPLCGD